ncbi:MAG: TRL-like family protein [Nonlabens sp.]
MKQTITRALALAVVAIMFTACSITMPVNATSNTVGSKVGTAKATVIFGVFAFNEDASIRTAAKNGGISKISTVDIKTGNILGLLVTYETIVTGE